MGTSVEAPEPTAEERALQSEQAALLRQQRDILLEQSSLQKQLLPIFAAQSGINLEFDDEGNVIGASADPAAAAFTAQQRELQTQFLTSLQEEMERQGAQEAELAPLRALQLQVETGLAERSLSALRGELPVDPALERELGTQERTLRDQLRQQLGPGFETSTPGIEALQKFREGAASLRSGAQTGQLTLAEQLGMARTGLREQTQASGIGQLLGGVSSLGQLGLATQQQAVGLPQQALFGPGQALAGGFGQVAGGFGQAQVPFQQQRAMQFQADIFNAQNSGIGALGGLFGGILGAIPFSSDAHLKRWWMKIGEMANGVPIYVFEYVWGERAIGVLAQDVPWATVEQNGYLAVDYERL